MRNTCAGAPRRGFALAAALIALALVAGLLATVGMQAATNRRVARHRHEQLQADWLARSGFELAVARLLSGPAGYTGEAAEPIPHARVRVAVEEEKGSPGRFRVVSEARYPADAALKPVVRSVTRTVRRVTDGGRVRIEVVAPGRPR